MPSTNIPYKRMLIKMSGESFRSNQETIDTNRILSIANQLKELYDLGIEIAIVTGGGNIFRGKEASKDLNRSTADYIGMLGTIMNSIALQNILESIGVSTRVQSALHIDSIAEPFIKLRAIRHLEKKRIVIFASGTGNPYFTTDTAAILRGMEINVDIVLKATKVNGIYEKDPFTNPNARKYKQISYQDFLDKKIQILDATAITICQEYNVPILVFNIFSNLSIKKIILNKNKNIGTFIQKCSSIIY